MTRPWETWDHVLKVDPDKDLVEGDTYADVCATGTDAIMIGGTMGITEEKMERVVSACAEYDVPLYLEPSSPDVAISDPGLEGYLIPTVINTADPFFLIGAHKEWIRMSESLPWSDITTEAYIVLNPDSSAAKYTDANTELSAADVGAYAAAADRLFGQEIVYIEYSGMYGDRDVVSAAAEAVADATVLYGGGIHDYESAAGMAAVADVIVVGDLVHDKGAAAVRETVEGAKQSTRSADANARR